MHHSGFAAPVLFRTDGTPVTLKSVPVGSKAGSLYDEAWLQRLFFQHPAPLPISEIDDSFSGLTPLCSELDTSVRSTPIFRFKRGVDIAGKLDRRFGAGRRGLVRDMKEWTEPE